MAPLPVVQVPHATTRPFQQSIPSLASSFAQNHGKQSYEAGLMVISSSFRIKAKEFVVSVKASGIIKLSE